MSNKSNDDINASLAMSKGWQRGVIDSVDVWFLPQIGSTSHAKEGPQPDSPDFCGDWALAGPLLEELFKNNSVSFDTNDNGDYFITTEPHGGDESPGVMMKRVFDENICCETLTEAIARAREAMIEEGEK